MAATAETLNQTQSIEQAIDRPNGRSIFNDSFVFYRQYEDLLPEEYGRVAYIPLEDEHGKVVNSHTILFDASTEAGSFVWQHTFATPGDRRVVKQLTVSKEGITNAWSALYDSQGRVQNVSDSTDDETIEAWLEIRNLVYSQDAQEKMEALRRQKDKQLENLALFAFSKEIEYLRYDSDSTDEEHKVAVSIRTKLADDKFEKEYEKRRVRTEQFGFVVSKIVSKPEI